MRRKYLKHIAVGILGAILLLLIWGAVIEPRLVDEKAETAFVPNLPSAWEGRRIALIAGLQKSCNGKTIIKNQKSESIETRRNYEKNYNCSIHF